MRSVRLCNRFDRSGKPCTNTTDYGDAWCRQRDCPGYVRADPKHAPPSYGPAMYLGTTENVPVVHVTVDVSHVRMTGRALHSFRFHHGGGERDAAVQMRSMLEDFLLTSARRMMPNGFLVLSREGDKLVVSPG